MKLNIFTPGEIFSEEEVEKIIIEGVNGYFCLLPGHIDYVAAIVPGILFYTLTGGEEVFVAVDEGLLVKKDREVFISVRGVIEGAGLGSLKRAVEENFEILDNHEKRARSILAKLEVDFARRFLELK
ncbi:F0F1 ATP synthase subunit epsilon [Desulfobacterium sp. N47]